MDDDKITCKRCIHSKVCIARDCYDAVVKAWNENYSFVKMSTNGDSLARSCKQYETLSDIHIIYRDQSEKKQEHHQSGAFRS
mgnify:CR=1 FL=1